MAGLVDLDGSGLDAVLADSVDEPLVVEFYGDQCPACQAIAGVLVELAAEENVTARFAKINLDSNPGMAERFAIRGVPVLIVFENGEPVRRTMPRLSRSAIRAFVEGTPA